MVERLRAKPGKAATQFRKTRDGQVDRRIGNGRPLGTKNKLPASVKECMVSAMEFLGVDGHGIYDDKGKVLKSVKPGKMGMTGYFIGAFLNRELGLRAAERLLPHEVTGKDGGPVRVLSIPPELIRMMTTEQMQIMQGVFDMLRNIQGQTGVGNNMKLVEHIPGGNASNYAKEIGVDA
jgi:hypothetical protein